MCWIRIWIIHEFADCRNHKTPPSSCSRALNGAIVIPQTTSPSASGKCEPSSRSWCDRPFNCLIQITCHRRAEATRWHLLIICPALVHTSVHPVQGSDCLLVPFVLPLPPDSFSPSICVHVCHSHPLSHSRSPPVALTHSHLFQFQSQHHFSSLLPVHPISACECINAASYYSSLLLHCSLFHILVLTCWSSCVILWSTQCDYRLTIKLL